MPSSVAFSLCVIAILCLVVVDASEWQTRIVGGSNATGNVCPHAVAIRLVGRDFLCNGALISNQDVLTAAQCVYNGNVLRNASEFQVVLGSLANTNSTGATVRSVAAVWPHPEYTPSTRISDVAVLRLSATVQNLTSLVPIQLATANAVVNRTCTMCGWGANYTTATPSATLQRLDVRIQQSNATFCTRANGNTTLRGDLICAGDLTAGRGACTGDQGAPLVCDARLQGVLTVVGGCGGLNETSIFVNTVYHRTWINNRTQTATTGGGTGGGGTGTGGSGGGGGGGGAASHTIMQIWVVMMPIVVLFALK